MTDLDKKICDSPGCETLMPKRQLGDLCLPCLDAYLSEKQSDVFTYVNLTDLFKVGS